MSLLEFGKPILTWETPELIPPSMKQAYWNQVVSTMIQMGHRDGFMSFVYVPVQNSIGHHDFERPRGSAVICIIKIGEKYAVGVCVPSVTQRGWEKKYGRHKAASRCLKAVERGQAQLLVDVAYKADDLVKCKLRDDGTGSGIMTSGHVKVKEVAQHLKSAPASQGGGSGIIVETVEVDLSE